MRESNYIMIKGSIHQEDIIIVHIYTSYTGTPEYVKQKTAKRKNSNTIIVGHFTTTLNNGQIMQTDRQ